MSTTTHPEPRGPSSPLPPVAVASALALRHELGDLVRLPSDADFDAVRTPWNVAVAQHPAAVAVPDQRRRRRPGGPRRRAATACGSPRRAPATAPARWPATTWPAPCSSGRRALRGRHRRPRHPDRPRRRRRGVGRRRAARRRARPRRAARLLAGRRRRRLHARRRDRLVRPRPRPRLRSTSARSSVVTADGRARPRRRRAPRRPVLGAARRRRQLRRRHGAGDRAAAHRRRLRRHAAVGRLTRRRRRPHVGPLDRRPARGHDDLVPHPPLPAAAGAAAVPVRADRRRRRRRRARRRRHRCRARRGAAGARARDGHLRPHARRGAHPPAHGPRGPDAVRRRLARPRPARRGAPSRRSSPPSVPTCRARCWCASCATSAGRWPAATPDAGALDHLPFGYLAFFVADRAHPEAAAAGLADVARVREALAPWDSGRHLLNLAEGPVRTSSAFDAATWQRLRDVRAAVDPDGLFAAAHEVPAAG